VWTEDGEVTNRFPRIFSLRYRESEGRKTWGTGLVDRNQEAAGWSQAGSTDWEADGGRRWGQTVVESRPLSWLELRALCCMQESHDLPNGRGR
jgi:hypothetical protein